MKEKDNFAFNYFFNQTRKLTADDSSSEDEDDGDDNDEDYIDLPTDDEYAVLSKSLPSKPIKSPVRKAKPTKHSP